MMVSPFTVRSGFAFDLRKEQAAVAGTVGVVIWVTRIPLRAKIQVERSAELEQEAWVGRGVIEQLRRLRAKSRDKKQTKQVQFNFGD